jgi:3-methyl-2-oxobutanoate hydroxymethyltransferase
VHAEGGYRVKGKSQAEFEKLLIDSRAVEKAGAFAVVLECTTPEIADKITSALEIPTIGIGASVNCDGQILVTDDMLGLTGENVPKFVKQYLNLSDQIDRALSAYTTDVKNRSFPAPHNLYKDEKKRQKKSA